MMASELKSGDWFRSEQEIWLRVLDDLCLRWGPEGRGFIGSGRINGVTTVRLEKPWFDVIRRKQPCRMTALQVGGWFDVDGDLSVLASRFGHAISFGFGGVQHWAVGAQTIVVPLEVQIRVDRKPLLRRTKEWFA